MCIRDRLCNEFRTYFPHNSVEYFVSYYDYYQPEAYVPQSDTYIDKEAIIHFDPLTGEVLDEVDHVSVWPASHYVTKQDTLERAVVEIKQEMDETIAIFEEQGKELEAHRLRQRTQYDIEMLKELGFCNGIENYSRIIDGLSLIHI